MSKKSSTFVARFRNIKRKIQKKLMIDFQYYVQWVLFCKTAFTNKFANHFIKIILISSRSKSIITKIPKIFITNNSIIPTRWIDFCYFWFTNRQLKTIKRYEKDLHDFGGGNDGRDSGGKGHHDREFWADSRPIVYGRKHRHGYQHQRLVVL